MKRLILMFALCIMCICISACAGDNMQEAVAETMLCTQPVTTEVSEAAEETTFLNHTNIDIPTEPERVPEQMAEQVVVGFQILIDGVDYTNTLSDDSYWSKRYIRNNQQLTIESQTEFSAIYIEWDELPGTYSIVWHEGSLECGQNGFFHEYIRFQNQLTV